VLDGTLDLSTAHHRRDRPRRCTGRFSPPRPGRPYLVVFWRRATVRLRCVLGVVLAPQASCASGVACVRSARPGNFACRGPRSASLPRPCPLVAPGSPWRLTCRRACCGRRAQRPMAGPFLLPLQASAGRVSRVSRLRSLGTFAGT